MIAPTDKPGPTRRRFSAEVEARLVEALVESEEHMSSTAAVRLDHALKDAAREARDNHIQVEDMMIAFKELEDQAARRARGDSVVQPSHMRIIRTLLDSYYR